MQKARSRRPHGILSRKISVSVSASDLEVLSKRADRLHGGNLSAVIHELVDSMKRENALDQLLESAGAHRITEKTLAGLRKEIASAPIGLPNRRKRSAA